MNASVRTLLPSRRWRCGLVLLTAGALVLVAGCKDHPYPIRFNNMIARANKRLNAAGQEFGAAAKAGDPKAIRSKYDALVMALKAVQDEFADIGAPTGAAYGSDLLDAYEAYLDCQEKIVNTHAKQIVQMAESGGLDGEQVSALLTKIGEEAKPKFAALEEAQKKFAEDLKLKLEK